MVGNGRSSRASRKLEAALSVHSQPRTRLCCAKRSIQHPQRCVRNPSRAMAHTPDVRARVRQRPSLQTVQGEGAHRLRLIAVPALAALRDAHSNPQTATRSRSTSAQRLLSGTLLSCRPSPGPHAASAPSPGTGRQPAGREAPSSSVARPSCCQCLIARHQAPARRSRGSVVFRRQALMLPVPHRPAPGASPPVARLLRRPSPGLHAASAPTPGTGRQPAGREAPSSSVARPSCCERLHRPASDAGPPVASPGQEPRPVRLDRQLRACQRCHAGVDLQSKARPSNARATHVPPDCHGRAGHAADRCPTG